MNKHLILNKYAMLAIGIMGIVACSGSPSEEQQAEAKETDLRKRESQEALMLDAPQTDAVELMQVRALRPAVSMPMYSNHIPIVQEPPRPTQNERYQSQEQNPVKLVSEEPVSTFSVDVDTGSYANVRRMINQGLEVPEAAVRIEEFINYFDYHYPAPESLVQPFSINTALSTAPWNKERQLLRIGLQGYQGEVAHEGKNLVFLLDVSGSMNQANKLPLLKRALDMLSRQLEARDRVSIVVYAGASGVVLEPTPGDQHDVIFKALAQLHAGGSTNGASGINAAYELAQKAFIPGGVNRVILATDGDFNVGISDHDALIELIEQQREKGIALTTLGFGHGNYNDYLMEQLADAGNGNYAYIDTINEARKVLVDEFSANMQIIAKDVKIQVEFNPQQVAEYRLIGYENRQLANEDFKNDKVDAGDIGAGHRVTAIYELSLHTSQDKFIAPLRYQQVSPSPATLSNELAFIKLRYKAPEADKSVELTQTVSVNEVTDFESQDSDFQFAVTVASFAHLLKDSKYIENIDYPWLIESAQANKGKDEYGYRHEFVQLLKNAQYVNASMDDGLVRSDR